jgi:hypothetical protein
MLMMPVFNHCSMKTYCWNLLSLFFNFDSHSTVITDKDSCHHIAIYYWCYSSEFIGTGSENTPTNYGLFEQTGTETSFFPSTSGKSCQN